MGATLSSGGGMPLMMCRSSAMAAGGTDRRLMNDGKFRVALLGHTALRDEANTECV